MSSGSGEDKAKSRAAKRRNAALEVFFTERSYGKHLTDLSKYYHEPLKLQDAGAASAIFSNFEALKQLNMQLVDKLTDEFGQDGGKWSETASLGSILLNYIPFFKIYTEFVNNHENAHKKIALLQDGTNVKSTKFQQLCEASNARLPLASLMITPIQRVTRYPMLLEQLLKFTCESHSDYADLKKSLLQTEEVAHDINKAMAEQQEAVELFQLWREFDGKETSFVSAGRKKLHQGKLIKYSRKSHDPYEFFLFNDLLIYAKKAVTGKWHEHRRITNDGSFQFKDPDQNNQYRNGKVFEIYSEEKSFKVEAESEQAKQVWLDHFETCKKWRGGGQTSARAIWAADNSSRLCSLCGGDFTTFNRRHHCRQCGALACQACSKYKLVINSKDVEEATEGQAFGTRNDSLSSLGRSRNNSESLTRQPTPPPSYSSLDRQQSPHFAASVSSQFSVSKQLSLSTAATAPAAAPIAHPHVPSRPSRGQSLWRLFKGSSSDLSSTSSSKGSAAKAKKRERACKNCWQGEKEKFVLKLLEMGFGQQEAAMEAAKVEGAGGEVRRVEVARRSAEECFEAAVVEASNDLYKAYEAVVASDRGQRDFAEFNSLKVEREMDTAFGDTSTWDEYVPPADAGAGGAKGDRAEGDTVEALEAALDAAVKLEEFEKCASLRDRINELKQFQAAKAVAGGQQPQAMSDATEDASLGASFGAEPASETASGASPKDPSLHLEMSAEMQVPDIPPAMHQMNAALFGSFSPRAPSPVRRKPFRKVSKVVEEEEGEEGEEEEEEGEGGQRRPASLRMGDLLSGGNASQWIKSWSGEHQVSYFLNPNTGDSAWELPQGAVEVAEAVVGVGLRPVSPGLAVPPTSSPDASLTGVAATRPPCNVAGCGRPSGKQGFCSRHKPRKLRLKKVPGGGKGGSPGSRNKRNSPSSTNAAADGLPKPFPSAAPASAAVPPAISRPVPCTVAAAAPPSPVQQSPAKEEGDPEVVRFLASINLRVDWAKTFQREEVDLETLRMMTSQDLKELGLPAGPCLKIIKKLPAFQ